MNEQQVFFQRMKLNSQLFADVFRRFFHLLFKNPENSVTSFVLKGFFDSSEELGKELINAALEAVQSRCELSDARLAKIIDKMSEVAVDFCDDCNVEDKLMQCDAIRHPEIVIPLISQLCGVISDELSEAELEKCDLDDFDQTYLLGDYAQNIIPIF